jgi:hypothetical protein
MYITRKMFQTLGIAAAIFLCVIWCQAGATGIDGSRSIICAFTSSAGCDNETGCEATTPERLNLPRFIRIDFNNKKIITENQIGEGTRTETQIKNFLRLDGQLFLQGVEIRAWSMVITETTGSMTLTASGDEEAFVLFGVCTVP